jgi:SAM-dependent methyltransferase
MASAQRRWSAALSKWAIPEEILRRAPESPWGFPPALFAGRPDELASPDSPSHRRALEVLPSGGTVIDVGVGMGRSSLPLATRAALIVGVDESESMLARFTTAAREAGVSSRSVLGTWPEVAPEAGIADVVVCHHVFYNVAKLGPFARALTDAARGRVVVEMTGHHPQSSLNELWRHFHGLERPTQPIYRDAVEVLKELSLAPQREIWTRSRGLATVDRGEAVAFARRRLCLPATRDAEIDALLEDDETWQPKEVVTLWWDGEATNKT